MTADDITNILGFFALASLFIFGITALLIYNNTKFKVFKWYSLYCFFLSIYIFAHIFRDYEFKFKLTSGMNWYIQTIFYTLYLRFGLYFIKFQKYRPQFSKIIFQGQIYVMILSTVVFILDHLGVVSMFDYFLYLFLPALLICSFIIIFNAWKLGYDDKKYFLYGSLVYIVLAMCAFILSMIPVDRLIIYPIDYFYIAVTLEAIIFSVGLGKQIKRIYLGKLKAEQDLNKTQGLLRIELEKRIQKQEEVNRLLQSENQAKELALQVTELNNTVLRNQMNSHFVFNVLNSIKLFMMQNNKDKAVQYLNKFAKLMRKILDANYYGMITLHEELQTIELYLSIELMRFDNSFSYMIDISPKVDLYAHRIPAFLLQPFIENVLWHAFMDQENDNHLLIQVTEDLRIIIEDNGIGRAAAQERKSSAKNNKSYGLKIIQERLKNYNEQHNKQVWYEIEDISTGTRVIIHLS